MSMTALMTPDTANFSGNVHDCNTPKLLDQVAYACITRRHRRWRSAPTIAAAIITLHKVPLKVNIIYG